VPSPGSIGEVSGVISRLGRTFHNLSTLLARRAHVSAATARSAARCALWLRPPRSLAAFRGLATIRSTPTINPSISSRLIWLVTCRSSDPRQQSGPTPDLFRPPIIEPDRTFGEVSDSEHDQGRRNLLA